ncbi:MAG: DNA-binding protein [Acidobacteria bacterium]|nr:DNA-binding protein [Acidobacteriota bacterium]
MRLRPSAVFIALALLLTAVGSSAQKKLTAAEARNHVGEEATVCGVIASARYVASSRGQPTFLNLDKPYPSQIFTIVIWGRNRGKFGKPEVNYKDKRICIAGTIESFRGVAQTEAKEPSQITVEKN